MLFSENDEPSLKTWLEHHLSRLSDAEAPILAEYCIALLKHDQSEEQVRQLCIDQLSDFLSGSTKSFVDQVFTVLKDRSYIKGGSVVVARAPLSNQSEAVPQATNLQTSSARLEDAQFPPMPLPPAGMVLDKNFLQFMQQQNGQVNKRKRKHCFAFEQKGYCHRGAACPFEHVIPLPAQNFHEYDPNNSAMSNGRAGHKAAQPFVRSTYQNQVAQQEHTATKKPDNKLRGSETDRTKSTLVVENIPTAHFDEESIKTYFQTFGPLEHVQIDRAEKQALVKFAEWSCANAAYTSPEPIFNNRFVKVFWLKPRGYRPKSGQNQSQQSATEMELDPTVLEAKQREHSERVAKKTEMEAKLAALAQQRAELLQRQEEQRQRIRALEKPHSSGSNAPSSEGTAALEAQLAELKAKAMSIGLQPDGTHGPLSRGAYRGRGSMRGRGRGAPYVGRPRTLDLRPRTIQIKPNDMSATELEAQIRASTEYEDVSVMPNNLVKVTFKTRREAEVFSTKKIGDMKWVENDVRSTQDTVMTDARPDTQDDAMSDDERNRYDD